MTDFKHVNDRFPFNKPQAFSLPLAEPALQAQAYDPPEVYQAFLAFPPRFGGVVRFFLS